MVVFPNAKINIGLNVVEKRNDGFHNIESIFYPVIDLYDVLELAKSDELSFSSSGIEIPGDLESNLCVKAYQLIKADFDIPFVKIHLHKVIPIGAGLGGGSADASFMLKALNELFELNLTNKQLIKYARQLGSDCTFFIENKPAYALNKGDELESINLDLSTYQIKIEYPNIHIGTAEAYAGIIPQKSTINLKQAIQQPIKNWKDTIKNNFEDAVFPSHPQIKMLKEKMYAKGALYASMSGSGSAVYGVFKL
jgi:4-diphosphocytidyl-2-C-methyl-D-erythritol kinase